MANFNLSFDSNRQTANDFTQFTIDVIRKWFEVAISTNPHSGKVLMYDGSIVNVLKFKPEDFNPEHAFNTLPNINRYNGNTYIPFSVGQHSLLCYNIAKVLYPDNKNIQLYCLIHDFTESVVGDCISPIKHLPILQGFTIIEDSIEKVILERLGLADAKDTYYEFVKKVDKLALTIELRNISKHADIPIWESYVYSDKDLETIFTDKSVDISNLTGIDKIMTMTPKIVEVNLRNTYYRLTNSNI